MGTTHNKTVRYIVAIILEELRDPKQYREREEPMIGTRRWQIRRYFRIRANRLNTFERENRWFCKRPFRKISVRF